MQIAKDISNNTRNPKVGMPLHHCMITWQTRNGVSLFLVPLRADYIEQNKGNVQSEDSVQINNSRLRPDTLTTCVGNAP
jgi:hypothetical protein